MRPSVEEQRFARADRGPIRARGRRRATAVLAFLALLTLLAPAVPIEGGDANLARFLLKGGREDLAAGRFDGAVSKFEKALAEDDTLIEAIYWSAAAQEGKKDSAAALKAYRAFRAACEAKKAGGGPSKDELALFQKAQARIDALSTAETELKKLDDSYVARLFAFAKANAARDSGAAGKALELLLDLQPRHAEAKALATKLAPRTPPAAGPAPAKEPDPKEPVKPADPFKAVKAWEPMLNEKALGTHGGWIFKKDFLTIDMRDSTAGFALLHRATGSRFVYEGEFRLLEAYAADWGVGLGFGRSTNQYAVLYLFKEMLGFFVGSTVVDREPSRAGERTAVDEIVPKTWHRGGLVVDGERLEAWLDGVKKVETTLESKTDWNGDLGLWSRTCKAEVRNLRYGRLP